MPPRSLGVRGRRDDEGAAEGIAFGAAPHSRDSALGVKRLAPGGGRDSATSSPRVPVCAAPPVHTGRHVCWGVQPEAPGDDAFPRPSAEELGTEVDAVVGTSSIGPEGNAADAPTTATPNATTRALEKEQRERLSADEEGGSSKLAAGREMPRPWALQLFSSAAWKTSAPQPRQPSLRRFARYSTAVPWRAPRMKGTHRCAPSGALA